MIKNLIAAAAGYMIAMGLLLIGIAVHDHNQSEDLTIVWACELQGNELCGPGASKLMIEPDNMFRNWEYVPSNWLN